MNPLPYMGSFVIDVKEMRREKITRKRDRKVKMPEAASLAHRRERCHSCSPFFTLHS
jgi:hypothetical protein